MTESPANLVIQVRWVNNRISFAGIKDFERIMQEDKFDLVYDSSSLQIWEPTKDAQKGGNIYTYLVFQDRLVNNTIYCMVE